MLNWSKISKKSNIEIYRKMTAQTRVQFNRLKIYDIRSTRIIQLFILSQIELFKSQDQIAIISKYSNIQTYQNFKFTLQLYYERLLYIYLLQHFLACI